MTLDAGNWRTPPHLREGVRRAREFVPWVPVRAAPSPSPLREAPVNLDTLTFADERGAPSTWPEFLARTHANAVAVWRDGALIYEHYAAGMGPEVTHLTFSITKSIVGLLAEQLISEGVLAETDRAAEHVPELSGTAFGLASVRGLLDMRDGVPFDETYADPAAEIHGYSKAWWGVSPDAPLGALAALRALPARPSAASPFSYRTPVSDVLGLIVARAAGRPLATLAQDRLWRPIGAEHDAWFLLDRAGVEIAGAGFGATLRDLLRLGVMLLNQGRVGELQVMPLSALARMAQGGCPEAFAASGQPTRPGWSYRSQWWRTHDAADSYCALGVFGQRLLIAPASRTVVARFGSHPVASNAETDRLHRLAFQALADR